MRLNALLLAMLCFAGSSVANGEELEGVPPVQPGEACQASSAGYTWKTVTAGLWGVSSITAIPVSFADPGLWPQNGQFVSAADGVRQEQTGPAAFADACVAVWNDFLEMEGKVFVQVQQSIHTRHRVLRCEDEVWSVQSDTSSETVESSEWLSLQSEPWDLETTASMQLSQKMNDLLADLNSQPSADAAPHDSYTTP